MKKLLLLIFFCAAQAAISPLLPNMRDETKTIKAENKLLSEDDKSYILCAEFLGMVVAMQIAHFAANRALRSSCPYRFRPIESIGKMVFGVGMGYLGMKLGGWYARRNV